MPSALELKIPRRLSRSRVKFRQARGVLIIKTARFLKNGARFIIISPLSLWSRIGIGRNLNWQRTEPGPVEMFPKAQPRPSEIQTSLLVIKTAWLLKIVHRILHHLTFLDLDWHRTKLEPVEMFPKAQHKVK